jgi:hypothetical protein
MKRNNECWKQPALVKNSRGTHIPVGLTEYLQIELFISSSRGYTTNSFDVKEAHI